MVNTRDPIFLRLGLDYKTYSASVDASEPSGLFDDDEEPALLGDEMDDVFEDGEGEE